MKTGTVRMIRCLIFAGAACAAGLAQQTVQVQAQAGIAGPTFRFVAGNMIGGSVVKNAPYAAETVTDMTQTLGDGTHIAHHSTAMEYRDSEGRQRSEQTLSAVGLLLGAQSSPVETVFISDPVAGVNYSLNPPDHTAMKLPQPPPPPAGGSAGPNVIYRQMTVQRSGAGVETLPAPAVAIADGAITGPSSNAVFIHREAIGTGAVSSDPSLAAPNVEQLGSKTISGVPATGTRTTITIPAGEIGNDAPLTIIDERWYSPDLQVTVQSMHSDPRIGTTTYSLQNVSRAEPDPTLFQVPADYTVTDPPGLAKIAVP